MGHDFETGLGRLLGCVRLVVGFEDHFLDLSILFVLDNTRVMHFRDGFELCLIDGVLLVRLFVMEHEFNNVVDLVVDALGMDRGVWQGVGRRMLPRLLGGEDRVWNGRVLNHRFVVLDEGRDRLRRIRHMVMHRCDWFVGHGFDAFVNHR